MQVVTFEASHEKINIWVACNSVNFLCTKYLYQKSYRQFVSWIDGPSCRISPIVSSWAIYWCLDLHETLIFLKTCNQLHHMYLRECREATLTHPAFPCTNLKKRCLHLPQDLRWELQELIGYCFSLKPTCYSKMNVDSHTCIASPIDILCSSVITCFLGFSLITSRIVKLVRGCYGNKEQQQMHNAQHAAAFLLFPEKWACYYQDFYLSFNLPGMFWAFMDLTYIFFGIIHPCNGLDDLISKYYSNWDHMCGVTIPERSISITCHHPGSISFIID